MKTIKQIADELGVSKQRVYRCIKSNNIIEAHQDRYMMYFDEAAQTLIKSHFSPILDRIDTVHDTVTDTVQKKRQNDTIEAHNTPCEAVNLELVALLRAELEAKNQQIENLTAALFAAQQKPAQALPSTEAEQSTEATETKQRDRGIFARFFGKRKE